ncbi:uncharacterized protein G2W53_005986 [Senna tora]|uniref:Uncharacterized protein n=1 Tax=Senna tora TaxID=362788 RepID=A0A834X3W6_9FABA|nr:uncharacterized protein G2W53_005986 [Senna tora]
MAEKGYNRICFSDNIAFKP